MKINHRGFSLVELMVVVAIIGIIVAIAVPNLIDAIDRSKQRATVADLHFWGTALSAYNADLNRFPPPGSGIVDVLPYVVPFTASTLPQWDHWKNDFHYSTDELSSYTIASWGKNDTFDFGCTVTNWFQYDCDITLADGIFTQAPS